MNTVTRRDVLAAIASISVIAAAPALAQGSPSLDLAAGRSIGEAYLAAHPNTNLVRLRQMHLPNGLDAQAMGRLRARAAADFRGGRIFMHEGWRLSETEAQLFALLNST
jgi:hypothetical protein